jgi:RNA polymerase sigma-70 factor (ECF subfamily)
MVFETNTSLELSHPQEGNTSLADEDALLVRATQQGELDAFETLVNRRQKRMFNLAFRITGDYDEACEVVQDVFVSAYKNIKTFRGDSKFTTWLTSITMNLSKNKLKQMKSQEKHAAYSLDEPIRTEDGQMTADPPSREPSVLEQLVKRDLQKQVQRCIHALDPDFREVLVLRDLQEFSYEEIGEILKLREGTVKSRLFRARELVKNCLKTLCIIF